MSRAVTPSYRGAVSADVSQSDPVYFRQLLSGRDFAVGDQIATEMVNFSYAVGDRGTGECLLVDPAHGVADLVDVLARDGMRVTGVLATHYHADHIGGALWGFTLEGVVELLDIVDCPIHVQRDEAPWVARTTGLAESSLTLHEPGDQVRVGTVELECLHTPGHTPGSQCFLIGNRLISGDTLFIDGCGRTDLPGADPELMYDSLQRLSALPDDTVVYPGHRYSMPSSAPMAAIRQTNYVFRPSGRQQWLSMFGM